jgi:hypothetical protein
MLVDIMYTNSIENCIANKLVSITELVSLGETLQTYLQEIFSLNLD